MSTIDSVSQTNLSYIDQIKKRQHKDSAKVIVNQGIRQEDFFSLLTKQLAHQDPFKPVSNDQMIAQMASFATINGIQKMNAQFESLNQSIMSNQALQASSLVGRSVLVPGNKVGLKEKPDKDIEAAVMLPNHLDNLFIHIEDENGQLIHSSELGYKPAGIHRIDWNGKDEDGNFLPAGKYKIKASGLLNGKNNEFAVSVYANVNSVLLGNSNSNSILLNLAGFELPVHLSEVLEIADDT
ncbi:basal-body rod modification protein flgD [Candidatus Photodesmus katoptron]|uniref:Basal-body rod modification protein FlgD n=1 Tax=Candidatus Photodesmus katoptron Akat1 TaxID=1236703 RepID=S3E1A5_9GAMM|nr:flagellar hook assembly protein FlgD [Candidatus Photodesmus katoptron]EPE37966.1 flagellar hook capping protein [Candidatus Photodesmus katoptron Akat1]KEY90248.1 basal-body rod modification protein flgD [Candidatus Photodesmus katoptron]